MKGFLLIIVAALLAALAGGLAYIYVVSASQAARDEATETVGLVVASRDMTFGTKLERDMISMVQFPPESVPVGAYADLDSVMGQTTKVFLVKGEPILASKLSTAGGGLSVRVPESMRAASVKVNEVSGVSGFILPGDRVDVVVTVDNLAGIGNAVTKTIVQNSEVLAAGVKTETKKDDPIKVQAVTLLVDPKQAEELALAHHQGTIHLVLRNPVDHEITDVAPTNTKEVMGERAKPKAPAPRPSPAPVRKTTPKQPDPPPETDPVTYTIIRNGAVEKEKFPNEAPKDQPVKR